jgi:lycopene beta-cyclase
MVHRDHPTSGPLYSKIAIVGGGLAGCLALHAVRSAFPQIFISLYEKDSHLCGVHTWCLYESDIPKECATWLRPLIDHSWSDYAVQFPDYSRHVPVPYHCLRSESLAQKTLALQNSQCRIELSSDCEILSTTAIRIGGQQIEFDLVIDCRGGTASRFLCAFQKFLGLEVSCSEPHGISRPTIMDATIPQLDGYRFFYVLPLSPTRLLVEDTYYSDEPQVEADIVRKRVLAHCEARGWKVANIEYEEIGSLPIPLQRLRRRPATVTLGTEAMRFHAVTGYSLPFLLQDIVRLEKHLRHTHPPYEIVLAQIRFWQKQWLRETFYLALNRMFFWGCLPVQRFRILQRFYRFHPQLIHRFYAGSSTVGDMLRLVSGKPPIPVIAAIKALIGFPSQGAPPL